MPDEPDSPERDGDNANQQPSDSVDNKSPYHYLKHRLPAGLNLTVLATTTMPASPLQSQYKQSQPEPEETPVHYFTGNTPYSFKE